ncbi:MAG: amidohydrolase family protein [Kiritimatiellae bacterium]|nr:amidohydrolase family protein [Kiritimatiellia bacterium]
MASILEFSGFIDVHVHFRDPGMPEAETTASGLAAAEKGGFALVVTMPNTSPAGDSVAWVKANLAARSANGTRIIPSACITKGRLGREVADLENLAEAGAAFFTDDGSYVADDRVMEEAMFRAKALGMAICEHAMDPAELKGGVIRDCPLARKLGLPVISVETETKAIERDLSICRTTGCRLHIQHISTARGVELVRGAQKEGLLVTAEATPHHLLFSCEELTADDANFKMAPPLGNGEDRSELRKAVKEGALMFATDHAPHPAAAKSHGFARSANGILGLETAIPATYRAMVEEEGMPIDAWARAWSEMPRAIIRGDIGELPPTCVIIGERRMVNGGSFASLSRNSPYGSMVFDCWPEARRKGG